MPFGYGFQFDPRLDGTPKGPGFATMVVPDYYGQPGRVTELSLGGAPGELFYPMVYQGIMPWEMDAVRNDAAYRDSDPRIRGVLDNAYLQAIVRLGQGRSPFWQMGDEITGLNYTPHK